MVPCPVLLKVTSVSVWGNSASASDAGRCLVLFLSIVTLSAENKVFFLGSYIFQPSPSSRR